MSPRKKAGALFVHIKPTGPIYPSASINPSNTMPVGAGVRSGRVYSASVGTAQSGRRGLVYDAEVEITINDHRGIVYSAELALAAPLAHGGRVYQTTLVGS